VQSIRAIGQNAESLAFMLAIKIVTPQLEDEMNKIKSFADKFNQFATDSCKAAGQVMEWGTAQMGWTEQCVQLRMTQNGEDRATAENNCTTGGKGGEQPANGTPKNTVAFVQGNVAWNALMQDSYFRNDMDTAELMMNIMGTVVVDRGTGSDPQPKITAQTSNIIGKDFNSEDFKNILNALLLGNQTKDQLTIYKCDSGDRVANIDSCMTLTAPQKITPNWIGIKPRIDALLASITQKIIAGTGSFSSDELGLIESTNLPVYRFISAATASDSIQFSGTDNPASQYSDLVAKDIVLRNIKSLVEKVRYHVENDQNNLSVSPTLKAYSKQLEEVLKGVTQLEDADNAQAKAVEEMQGKITKYERQILPRISKSYLAAAKFGN
jgi:conjugative transfer pilus assembly protein TraH